MHYGSVNISIKTIRHSLLTQINNCCVSFITYHAIMLVTDRGVLFIAGYIFNTLRTVLYNKQRNKLTNSAQQILSRETNRFSASEEIPLIL